MVYNGFFLMKFMSKYQYQQEFLDGQLFFNTTDYFASCDDAGRGDHNEGDTFIIDIENPNLFAANLELVDGEYAIVVRDYSNCSDQYKPGSIFSMSKSENRYRKILSMYSLFVDTNQKTLSPFCEQIKEEFGDYGVLVINTNEFINRIQKKVNDMSNISRYERGFVNYLHPEDELGYIDWSPFTKKSVYSYQQEFRFSFINDNRDALKLDLGCSLRDIAVPILSSDIDKIEVINNKLYYPTYH